MSYRYRNHIEELIMEETLDKIPMKNMRFTANDIYKYMQDNHPEIDVRQVHYVINDLVADGTLGRQRDGMLYSNRGAFGP